VRGYLRELQTSVLNNSSAYGYSVSITGCFGITSKVLGQPSVLDVFLFGIGAVLAFAALDVVASGGFRKRIRGEPPEVVVLGAAMSFFSVSASLGAAVLATEVILGGDAGWLLSSLLATFAYVAVVAVELTVAASVDRGSAEADGPRDQRSTGFSS